ncbi:MAG: ABC transporter substrate-binding protein [Candidatus Lokiarchaeota archaeon]|nr:ABC transporter substrate-binding protein [Candidatus Lokiarchaeota archaeon]
MNCIKKKELRIGHLSTAYHTNFILMGDDKLEKDLGLKVKWSLFGTGPLMVEAFKNEELDIGYMGLPPAIIGIDNGVPIRCVAGGHVEGTIMIGKKNYKPISKLNDDICGVLTQFKGHSIGTPSVGSIHDAILNFYLEKYDLSNDIEVINYKQAEFIALDMQKGKLEGGVGTPALAVFAETILDSHLIIPAHYLLAYNPSYGIFFHESIIKDYPELVFTFLKHHKKASGLLRESQIEAAKIIARTFSILKNNIPYVKAVLEISPRYCIALSEGYLKSTEGFINTMHSLGYIKDILSRDKIYNFEFVSEVHPEKEHYK